MDILEYLINQMSKEEVRSFKLYAQRFGSTEGRKDLYLFDEIRKKADEFSEDKVFKKLYDSDKNAFYRLKNRLLSDLTKSLSLQYFDTNNRIHAMHLLAMSQLFREKNRNEAAHYFLKKAEGKSKDAASLDLLEIVYGEYIQLSHSMLSINPEEYIQKRKELRRQEQGIQALDDVLAAVNYRMKTTQNFGKSKSAVLEFLQHTIDDLSDDPDLKKNPAFKIKLYQAASQILLQRRDYKALEAYLLETYKDFISSDLFNRNTHETKLQMLTYIVNSLFKNNRNKESLKWAEELKTSMEAYQRLHYEKYVFFYYNSLVINYSKLDPLHAIEILEGLKEDKRVMGTSYYQVFVHLNLAVLNFDRKSVTQALKEINRLFLLDMYSSLDTALRFKIGIAELIMRKEAGQRDVLKQKLQLIRKEFPLSEENKRDFALVEILEESLQEGLKADKRITISKVKSFLNEKDHSAETDSDIIKYSEWLRDHFRIEEALSE